MTAGAFQVAEFDYIIVGAGSSGSVLAERLSADGKSSVLLLEEGSDNHTELVNMPRAFMMMWGNPKHFWSFPVESSDGRTERDPVFYGRGLGGSSSTNGTWFMRGLAADFDAWRDLGLPEWSWDEAERCYRAMESYRAPGAGAARGRNGPLQISQLPFRSRFLDAAIKASEEFGVPFLEDINTPDRQGIGYSQASVDRRGRRASAYRAFLKPAMRRPNLTVMTGALVQKIDFDGLRAAGVTYRLDDKQRQARTRGEVILAAGVLQSPKLLQLSGIGPADALEQAGIPVLIDSPQVGRNLADHVTLSLSFRMKGEMGANREFGGWRMLRHVAQYYTLRSGLMAYTCPELTAMIAMDCPPDRPNVQIGIGPFSMRSSIEMKADPGRGALETEPGYTLNAYYLQPKNRGCVTIQSADIADPVVVCTDWWNDQEDRQGLVRMIRLMREFAAQPALREFTVGEVTPGAQFQSDEEIASQLEWLAGSGLHATGTCRMGSTPEAVLDSRLRVRGVKGLRVVDCSSMPTLPSGNTNAPAMMLGYRAAELILEDKASAPG